VFASTSDPLANRFVMKNTVLRRGTQDFALSPLKWL
jgi:hypothetical protein